MLFIQRRKRSRSPAVEISDGDFALERSNFAFARKSVHCQSCQGSTKHSPPKVKYQIDCTCLNLKNIQHFIAHQNKCMLNLKVQRMRWPGRSLASRRSPCQSPYSPGSRGSPRLELWFNIGNRLGCIESKLEIENLPPLSRLDLVASQYNLGFGMSSWHCKLVKDMLF